MDFEKKSILLVDDEVNITNALRRDLSDWLKDKSMNIFIANSAKAGLEILSVHSNEVIIIISDLKMPEMKGSDFLLEVKAKYPEIVSILLTGFSETTEIIKAVDAGIFAYMLKPWDYDALIVEVQKAYNHSKLLKDNASYHKMIEEELKWAGEMQKAILKPNLPHSEGVEFRVSYRPLSGLYCGGDYYDVIFLSNDHYLLLIGDVAGHGVKAAFVTGILKAIIYSEYVRNVGTKDFSPGAFLAWLNDRMNYEFRSTSNMLITLFAGVLDLKNMVLKYANAGHNHPYIIRNANPIEVLVSGTGIGMAKSIMYPETIINLEKNDQLVLYTDGLIEINCAHGKEPLSIKNLLEKIPVGVDYHKKLIEFALQMTKSEVFTDDLTIVTAKLV